MTKRLFLIAAPSSPVIALYGVAPLYILGGFPFPLVAVVFIGLTIHSFVIWTAHILFISRYSERKPWLQFAVTYAVGAAFQLLVTLVGGLVNFQRPPIAQEHVLYPILTSFAVNAIIMVITRSVVSEHLKQKAEQEVQAIRLQASEAQRQVLMRQLQPHFLFNALAVLKSLIGEDKDAAREYTVRLSDFLRYGTRADAVDVVTLEEELKFTNDYLDLQRTRFGRSFTCRIALEAASLQRYIPMFALQTVVENAFKHNAFTVKAPLHISITGSDVEVSVSNSLKAATHPEANGTGLANLGRRYALISGQSLSIHQTETHFNVALPLLPV